MSPTGLYRGTKQTWSGEVKRLPAKAPEYSRPAADARSLGGLGNLQMTYPILEHDPTREAFIEPSKVDKERNVPEYCVICFFMDIIEKVVSEHAAQTLVENRWGDGPHPVYKAEYRDQRLACFHPGIGSALSAGILEEVIAFGCSKFILAGL